MGMVGIVKETNKMLSDVTLNFEECISILYGSRVEKRDMAASKAPECLMDDIMLVREKVAVLYEMSCKFRDILNGDERPIEECLREPRY